MTAHPRPAQRPRRARFAALTSLASLASLLALAAALALPLPAGAHEGEDHGAPEALPAAPGATRFEAVSELFEVVGIANPGTGKLTLYVDRYADNQAADVERLEIEAGEHTLSARASGPGRFEAEAPWLRADGALALTLTLSGKDGDDLLAATLPAPAGPAAQTASAPPFGAATALLALPVVLLAGLWLRRRRGAAPIAVLFLLGVALGGAQPGSALAHGGEEHDAEAAAPAAASAPGGGERPQRLADGSVFLPKPAQRALAMRTVVAHPGEHRATLELAGRVIADPASGGVVQAPFAGRIEAPAGGLPQPGQRVRRGEVLAWLAPLGSGMERADARARAAELQAQLALAEKRAARLGALEGSVPEKEIEAATIEADGLRQRLAAVRGGLSGRDALRAPVDGVVGETRLATGQIVDARDTLYEIVDPRRLMVEALAYEALPGGALEASAVAGRDAGALPLKLVFAGAGRSLREQALPLRFRIAVAAGEAPPLLATGQAVRVHVRVGRPLAGVALPVEAVVRGADNQPRVWLHTAAERYQAHRVESLALDAGRVLITRGLSGGERVVTVGAALLAQIR